MEKELKTKDNMNATYFLYEDKIETYGKTDYEKAFFKRGKEKGFANVACLENETEIIKKRILDIVYIVVGKEANNLINDKHFEMIGDKAYITAGTVKTVLEYIFDELYMHFGMAQEYRYNKSNSKRRASFKKFCRIVEALDRQKNVKGQTAHKIILEVLFPNNPTEQARNTCDKYYKAYNKYRKKDIIQKLSNKQSIIYAFLYTFDKRFFKTLDTVENSRIPSILDYYYDIFLQQKKIY